MERTAKIDAARAAASGEQLAIGETAASPLVGDAPVLRPTASLSAATHPTVSHPAVAHPAASRPASSLAATSQSADSQSQYPLQVDKLPPFDVVEGRYRCRFARSAAELDRTLRLRYEVFNLELHEGLRASHLTGLDRDRFDAQCHHLMVEEIASGEVIGTYRMQVAGMARGGSGFYTAGEFQLDAWPREVVDRAVEIGRACVAAEHRRSPVLLLLWKGLVAYGLFNDKRYFFGCCSIPSQDVDEAARVSRYLEHHGFMSADLSVEPQPAYALRDSVRVAGWESTKIPKLFRTYLRYGAKICGRPAIDREFKTIDYLALVDLYGVDPVRVLQQFELDMRAQVAESRDAEPPSAEA